jgi:hypothetical protein
MTSTISKWNPVSDVDCEFGSIQFSFENDEAVVRMVGDRTLVLRFLGVVALRFEQECPGFDFPPLPLPTLRESATFPLLRVEASSWREQYRAVYPEISHFALVSSDHLLQILARSDVEARWDTA